MIGRRAELATLVGRIGAACDGRGGALLVTGEPGIGKSALCEAAVTAAGLRVLRARPAEAEAGLPYGVLSDLVEPLRDSIGALPGPRGTALLGALGLGPPSPGDRFTVAAATLSLLAVAAEAEPLLVFVDDFHWADRPSAEALLFAARRLVADPVMVLLAARDSTPAPIPLDGAERVEVGPLTDADARALLASGRREGDVAGRGSIAEEVAERILAAAGGNPLALVEIPRRLTPAQLDGSYPLPDPLRPGARVEDLFRPRVLALGERGRRALALVAADATGDLSVLRGALGGLGLSAGDLDAAERDGLVARAGRRLDVLHPLIRSAAYGALEPAEARETHLALADACGAERPVERAAHLARGALGPSEETAAEIEGAATAALGRGAYHSAASLLESAAGLSTSAAEARRRLAQAGGAAFAAGDPDRSLSLLDGAALNAADDVDRACIHQQRGYVLMWRGPVAEAKAVFDREAARIAEAAPELAASIFIDGAIAASMLADVREVRRMALLADACARNAGEAIAAPAAATLAFARGLAGEASADELDAVIPRLMALPQTGPREPVLIGFVTIGSLWTDGSGGAGRVLDGLVAGARAAASPTAVAFPLALAAKAAFVRGDPSAALAGLTESISTSHDTAQEGNASLAYSWRSLALTTLGEPTGALADARASIESAERAGVRSTTIYARSALGHAHLMAGDATAAVRVMDDLPELVWDECGMRHPSIEPFAPDLVEALVACGRDERAREVAARYEEIADHAGFPHGRALAARARAIAEPDDARAADEHLGVALELHEEAPVPLEVARTRLALGELLVRRPDARRAVPVLRGVLRDLVEMDARPLMRRARAALASCGAPDHRVGASDGARLTPQERQVAERVAEGLGNDEIAGELFVTRRTVEFHLTNIYRKLGISRRTELARAILRREVR